MKKKLTLFNFVIGLLTNELVNQDLNSAFIKGYLNKKEREVLKMVDDFNAWAYKHFLICLGLLIVNIISGISFQYSYLITLAVSAIILSFYFYCRAIKWKKIKLAMKRVPFTKDKLKKKAEIFYRSQKRKDIVKSHKIDLHSAIFIFNNQIASA